MKKKIIILIIITVFILTAFLVPYLIFINKAPVLIVSDEGFISYYGVKRIKKEALKISLNLFRPVKTVSVANDAGSDLAALAVSEISAQPYCALFPLRFAGAAKYYREKNPQIPVVILEGRYPENANPSSFSLGNNTSGYFIYKNDVESDFYKAAGAALIIDKGQNGKIAVFIEPGILTQARTAFLQGLKDFKELFNIEIGPESLFFSDYSSFYERNDISCAVVTTIGIEFVDRRTVNIPIILFSWIEPLYAPDNAVIIIDDSPLAQVKKAVSMVEAGEEKGKIPSKFQFIKMKNFDKETLRKLTKTW